MPFRACSMAWLQTEGGKSPHAGPRCNMLLDGTFHCVAASIAILAHDMDDLALGISRTGMTASL